MVAKMSDGVKLNNSSCDLLTLRSAKLFRTREGLVAASLILLLFVQNSSCICVWEGNGGFKLACGFRQSGLFRIRSLGGLKGWAGAGFTIGDEDGFKDSLTNADSRKQHVTRQQAYLKQMQQHQALQQHQGFTNFGAQQTRVPDFKLLSLASNLHEQKPTAPANADANPLITPSQQHAPPEMNRNNLQKRSSFWKWPLTNMLPKKRPQHRGIHHKQGIPMLGSLPPAPLLAPAQSGLRHKVPRGKGFFPQNGVPNSFGAMYRQPMRPNGLLNQFQAPGPVNTLAHHGVGAAPLQLQNDELSYLPMGNEPNVIPTFKDTRPYGLKLLEGSENYGTKFLVGQIQNNVAGYEASGVEEDLGDGSSGYDTNIFPDIYFTTTTPKNNPPTFDEQVVQQELQKMGANLRTKQKHKLKKVRVIKHRVKQAEKTRTLSPSSQEPAEEAVSSSDETVPVGIKSHSDNRQGLTTSSNSSDSAHNSVTYPSSVKPQKLSPELSLEDKHIRDLKILQSLGFGPSIPTTATPPTTTTKSTSQNPLSPLLQSGYDPRFPPDHPINREILRSMTTTTTTTPSTFFRHNSYYDPQKHFSKPNSDSGDIDVLRGHSNPSFVQLDSKEAFNRINKTKSYNDRFYNLYNETSIKTFGVKPKVTDIYWLHATTEKNKDFSPLPIQQISSNTWSQVSSTNDSVEKMRISGVRANEFTNVRTSPVSSFPGINHSDSGPTLSMTTQLKRLNLGSVKSDRHGVAVDEPDVDGSKSQFGTKISAQVKSQQLHTIEMTTQAESSDRTSVKSATDRSSTLCQTRGRQGIGSHLSECKQTKKRQKHHRRYRIRTYPTTVATTEQPSVVTSVDVSHSWSGKDGVQFSIVNPPPATSDTRLHAVDYESPTQDANAQIAAPEGNDWLKNKEEADFNQDVVDVPERQFATEGEQSADLPTAYKSPDLDQEHSSDQRQKVSIQNNESQESLNDKDNSEESGYSVPPNEESQLEKQTGDLVETKSEQLDFGKMTPAEIVSSDVQDVVDEQLILLPDSEAGDKGQHGMDEAPDVTVGSQKESFVTYGQDNAPSTYRPQYHEHGSITGQAQQYEHQMELTVLKHQNQISGRKPSAAIRGTEDVIPPEPPGHSAKNQGSNFKKQPLPSQNLAPPPLPQIDEQDKQYQAVPPKSAHGRVPAQNLMPPSSPIYQTYLPFREPSQISKDTKIPSYKYSSVPMQTLSPPTEFGGQQAENQYRLYSSSYSNDYPNSSPDYIPSNYRPALNHVKQGQTYSQQPIVGSTDSVRLQGQHANSYQPPRASFNNGAKAEGLPPVQFQGPKYHRGQQGLSAQADVSEDVSAASLSEKHASEKETLLKALETLRKMKTEVIQNVLHEKLSREQGRPEKSQQQMLSSAPTTSEGTIPQSTNGNADSISLPIDAISSLFSPPTQHTHGKESAQNVIPDHDKQLAKLKQASEILLKQRLQEQIDREQYLKIFQRQELTKTTTPVPVEVIPESTKLKLAAFLQNSQRNYSTSQLATIRKILALNHIEQSLKSASVLPHARMDTPGSSPKLSSTYSAIQLSQWKPPGNAAAGLGVATFPTQQAKNELQNFAHRMLAHGTVAPTNNSIFRAESPTPVSASIPSLHNLRKDIQGLDQALGSAWSQENIATKHQAIGLSAILASPSQIHERLIKESKKAGSDRELLREVKNAPKSFYPGETVLDFDTHTTLYTKFKCEDQKNFPGLYADPDLSCKVFHLCANTDKGYMRKSFRCPQGTVFDQEVLRCNWSLYVDCSTAPSKYYLNKYLSESFQFLRALGEFSSSYKIRNPAVTQT